MESIGAWIRAARGTKQWSQDQLGDAVGVTKANISHWETGKHEPSFGQLLKIRDVTGFPIRDVGPAADWPLPRIRREILTSLDDQQLESLQAGILGIVAAITSSAGQAHAPAAEPAVQRKRAGAT